VFVCGQIVRRRKTLISFVQYLAAHRGGIKRVVIPFENTKDLEEIPDNVKQDLEIHPVRWIDQVLALALQEPVDRVTLS
jgi:ATP-dependent Lon protease